jgi:hypothetical protein
MMFVIAMVLVLGGEIRSRRRARALVG